MNTPVKFQYPILYVENNTNTNDNFSNTTKE